ncbi:MAG: hypothetical protein AAFR51_12495 [Pseudomonadota bacterium]
MFNKPKKGNELLTELDISRVVGSESVVEETPEQDQAEALQEADTPMSNIETWKQNDLDLLQMTWQACCDDPENEDSVEAFRSALHNLYGASGAYGGGALTRISGSLQELVSKVDALQDDAALINLHVQACRATSFGSDEGADDVADAVCKALEEQVEMRLFDLSTEI